MLKKIIFLLILASVFSIKAQTSQIAGKKGKYWIVSTDGKKISKNFDSIFVYKPFKKTLFKAWKKGECFLFDSTGRGGDKFMVDEAIYLKRHDGNNFLITHSGGDWARISMADKFLTDSVAAAVADTVDGFSMWMGGTVGIFNCETMKWALPPVFKDVLLPEDLNWERDSVKPNNDTIGLAYVFYNSLFTWWGSMETRFWRKANLPLIAKYKNDKYSLVFWDGTEPDPSLKADTIIFHGNSKIFYAYADKKITAYGVDGKKLYPQLKSVAPLYSKRYVLITDEASVALDKGTIESTPFWVVKSSDKNLNRKKIEHSYFLGTVIKLVTSKVGIYDLEKKDTVVAPLYETFYFYSPSYFEFYDTVSANQTIKIPAALSTPTKKEPVKAAAVQPKIEYQHNYEGLNYEYGALDAIYIREPMFAEVCPALGEENKLQKINLDFPFWAYNKNGFTFISQKGKALLSEPASEVTLHRFSNGTQAYIIKTQKGMNLYSPGGKNILPLENYEKIEVGNNCVLATKNGKSGKIEIQKQ